MQPIYDYVIIGSGVAGLTAGALLARAGASVCLLEAHEHPGGCAHSFPMGRYTFCAAVHYIFFCGEGEPVYNVLKKLSLHDRVTFTRLDPEGYDHFRCPSRGLAFRIPNGLDKWADRLIDRYPAHRPAILTFFRTLRDIMDELRRMPFFFRWCDWLGAPVRFPFVLRYRRWTLQALFDRLGLPPEVQAILATQVGDLGLPPREVSLVLFAALVSSYGAGAYHPTHHFRHFIESLADVIRHASGCALHLKAEVSRIAVEAGRVRSVETRDGRRFTARTVVANIDPQVCVRLVGHQHFPRPFLRKVGYRYSVSSYTIYLGVRGLDLREYGFGNWNVWHYPHLDINRAYHAQSVEGDLSDPWLFLSTPTLMSNSPERLCPEGEQILEAVTVCNYDEYHRLRTGDRTAYRARKKKAADRILDVLEAHYVPGLRRHVVLKVSGSPTTNVRYLWAPRGNIYGSELTPANVDFDRLRFLTPIPNLFFTGASAEFPSVGACISGGARLYTYLTGDPVNPGRDRYGLV